jgi:hypothetical protein
MRLRDLHTVQALKLALGLGVALLVGCSPTQRDLSQLKQQTSDANGSHGGTLNATQGGANSSDGGTSANLGGLGSLGGTNNQASGSSAATGGASSAAGTSAGLGGSNGLGGNSAGGDTTANGGTTATTGGSADTHGGAGGTVAATGGASSLGGQINAAGAPTCVPAGNEVCDDGIDNDCNGTLDCPVIAGRFPEPGRASAGDDAWVQLNPPVNALGAVQCRTGSPTTVGTKPWLTCDASAPTALKLYSMGLAEAKLDTYNGVIVFEFRFVYRNGMQSDPRQLVFYAHNSLWDNVNGTSGLVCPKLQTDEAYFTAARPYIAPVTSSAPTFGTSDLQLKNPFIRIQFAPSYVGEFVATSAPQVVSVLSLRHRFVVDGARQLLLVTRYYESSRAPKQCAAATIEDHDTYLYVPSTNKAYKQDIKVPCEAIVLNPRGTGVCLGSGSGTLKVLNENSNKIIAFLQGMGIPWPKADPMMWQKLFNDRPARHGRLYFSDKCATEDLSCRTAHAGSPILPGSGDAYFSTP